MAPPKKPNFPTLAERQSIMAELLQAEQNGTAPTNNEHYRSYVEKLKQLNDLMDRYSEINEADGLPPTLTTAGQEELLTAMRETALLGEAFLADAANKQAKLNAGVPGMVGRVQGMLAKDFALLRDYDPALTPLSFPELQENARTLTVDFRGQKIGIMTNKLSGRIPMTVVDAQGKRRMGVFTKAIHMNIKQRFDKLMQKAMESYDAPEFRNAIAPYKRALINQGAFPGLNPEQITDDMVVEKLKEPLRNALPTFRAYLRDNNKSIYGQDPMTAPDEHILSLMYNELGDDRSASVTLKKAGIDLDTIPVDAAGALTDGIKQGVKEHLSDTINARDLGLRDGERVDNRNSAMSAVASLLGLSKLCAKSTNMKYLDEDGSVVEGTFMEYADGLDLLGKKGEALFSHVCDNPFGSPCKANRDLADMQIMDFLSGNVDRHGGNMTYKVDDNGKIVGAVAFDNDTSFGVIPVDKKKGCFRLAGVQQLRVITEPMARKVAAISPNMLRFALRGHGLTPAEIDASCQRLKDLQEAIQTAKRVNNVADLKSSKGKLCIIKPEDLEKIPFNALADEKHTLFEHVRQNVNDAMEKAREKYPYKPGKARPARPVFEEVSTTDRVYAAGGIAASMRDMDRALKNEVTGFEVGGLSRFLHSSGKWRSMISAVKDATKAAKAINKAIGKDKEYLSRNDPKVKKQLDQANRAMENVRKTNEEYLQRKMREKHVNTPEELIGRGKHTYEQKRIDYALKLRKSIQAYDELQNPQSEQQKTQKSAIQESLELASKRRAQQAQQNQDGPVRQ